MRILTILLALLVATTAVAQPPTPPRTPEGDDRIVLVRRGEPAPFDGRLFDTDTAIRWTLRLEWYDREVTRQYQLRLDSIAVTEANYQLRLDLVEDSYGREIAGLREDLRAVADDLAEASDPGFFRSARGGFILGVLACVLVAAAGLGVAAGVSR